MVEARYYRKEGEKVQCQLCPHLCRIAEGETGICGVRSVRDGSLDADNYGVLAAVNWDPIEKKPLYHYYPGWPILSLGTYGCNLSCSFCQNWTLARSPVSLEAERAEPTDILKLLHQEGGANEVLGVAYTYNEPLIWFEFVLDTARLLKKNGYRNVLVTNGYINEKPLQELLPFIDAMNIDVKGFSDQFYQKYCRGKREPVLRTVEAAVKSCHVEITCLLIPSLNDHPSEQEALINWLSSLDPNIVLHYSRYFPRYKLDLPPTGEDVLERTLVLAKKKLNYVYLGNIEIPGAGDTRCPHCGNLVVSRSGYRVKVVGLQGGNCNRCGKSVKIINGELG